ncbi:hypothetical protein BD324DRAFT_653301 [Kockovaella imperatae]|uniref:Uncharacterized protein n=1 Tax=Kockovaella imperatae TaxID=4999 RepID=A0A1Y1U927_9TREE|nr:hypothetical protein BD324DRAFT_653301 [Kockovaella imperatae]ORX34528.1 hypothetical protein BD324DRAFT_653301 [Kockovaella imperatae]
MFDRPPFRVGLMGGLSADTHVKRAACDLASGALYSFPNASSVVDASQPVTFKWNTACPMDTDVDLYLYAASSQNGQIQVWLNAPFASGEYTAILRPKWWNDTTTADLQLTILNAGTQPWDSTSPPGPIFKVTYPADKMFTTTTVNGQAQTNTAAAAATQSKDTIFQNVSVNDAGRSGISKGAIAAAVIVPLLFLAVIAGVAVWFWRKREAEKLKRWSQAMSSASNLEWEKGARPGETRGAVLSRPNTNFSARPMSQFSGRPNSHATSSVYAVENNMAGTGAAGNFPHPPAFGQFRSQSAENLSIRSSMVLPDGSVRQSRISFAETTRGDRRSRLSVGDNLSRPNIAGRLPAGSRSADALHTMGHQRNASYATGSAIADEDDINVSPSQLQGPDAFADAQMRRAANGQRIGRKSILGGSRRNSTTSTIDAADLKYADSARGSVDELREMEASVLARRSQISLTSRSSPAPGSAGPTHQYYDTNQMESLSAEPSPVHPLSPSGQAGPGGSSTVQYGPDQMLAVYAQRKAGTPMASAPAPGDMRSFVHLNNGTMSSNAVNALPHPGPKYNNLAVPPNGKGQTRNSDGSAYSEDAVGEAR